MPENLHDAGELTLRPDPRDPAWCLPGPPEVPFRLTWDPGSSQEITSDGQPRRPILKQPVEQQQSALQCCFAGTLRLDWDSK